MSCCVAGFSPVHRRYTTTTILICLGTFQEPFSISHMCGTPPHFCDISSSLSIRSPGATRHQRHKKSKAIFRQTTVQINNMHLSIRIRIRTSVRYVVISPPALPSGSTTVYTHSMADSTIIWTAGINTIWTVKWGPRYTTTQLTALSFRH